MKKIIRFFFNWWYRIRPPEMVQYWKRSDTARARVVRDEKDGAMKMQIEGEKYLYPGFPRGHILMGPLAKLKNQIKNRIFNEIFEQMQEHTHEMLPPEKMVPAVRELWRVLEELENAEVTPDMKGRIKLIRTTLCFFLQEDDAYRFRFQWVMERMKMSRVKLTKEDKYFFRGKYFKVDHDKFDY